MTEHNVIIRVDATYHLTVQAGDKIHQGQGLSEEVHGQTAPTSGIVMSIHFDGPAHEFVIVVSPADAPGDNLTGS